MACSMPAAVSAALAWRMISRRWHRNHTTPVSGIRLVAVLVLPAPVGSCSTTDDAAVSASATESRAVAW